MDDPRLYPSLSLSCFLLPPGSKKADASWRRWHTEIIEQWRWDEALDNHPDSNVAVVGGAGGLVIWDIDYQPLVNKLKAPLSALDTWVVETGSGKLHVYFRSDGDLSGENLDEGKDHLGEIRGTGQYVVAPPSRVNESDHFQSYCTLYGSPAKIRRVSDAKSLIHRLMAAAVFGTTNLQFASAPAEDSPPLSLDRSAEAGSSVPNRWLSPTDERGWRDRVHHDEHLDARVKQIMLNSDTSGFKSPSEADWAVVRATLLAGYSTDEVEQVLIHLPCSGHYHANKSEKTVGHAYFLKTLESVQWVMGKAATAASLAQGENFHVLWVKKRMYEPPLYTICVKVGEGGEATFTCESDDIVSEARFRRKLAPAMNDIPKFAAKGKQYEVFSASILQMAEIEEIPQDAKAAGILRSFIVGLIREPQRMAPHIPDDQHDANLGWYDRGNGHLDVRGTYLLRFAQSTPTLRAVKPEDLWQAVAAMGGVEHQVHFKEGGMTERVWSLPSTWLEPEKEDEMRRDDH